MIAKFITSAIVASVAFAPGLVAGQTQNQPAQQQAGQPQPGQQFSSDDAILDTSILFAIGAHQAEQSLRGAFGWSTFQEGLVDGVYFRFDPDGYARFAPNARLDQDAFEVVCAPRSRVCAAKKDVLELGLTPGNELQIVIAGVRENDAFFVTDGKNELPLPPRIFQPLDVRLETLLAAGGELIVRRDGNEFRKISLVGFNAVATYLRWVSSGQDSLVFPRGWPAPSDPIRMVNSAPAQNGWTQPAQNQQPQATGYQQIMQQRDQVAASGAPQQQPVAVQPASPQPAQQAQQQVPNPAVQQPQTEGDAVSASISQLQAQLEALTQMMEQTSPGANPVAAQPTMQAQPGGHAVQQNPAAYPNQAASPQMPSHQNVTPQQWPGSVPVQVVQRPSWDAYRNPAQSGQMNMYPQPTAPNAVQMPPMHSSMTPMQQSIQLASQQQWQRQVLQEQEPTEAPSQPTTDDRLEALFARLAEIDSREGSAQPAPQMQDGSTGGKTKKPADESQMTVTDPPQGTGRQAIQAQIPNLATPHGTVTPIDERIGRLEEMLARLLNDREPPASGDRVDLGAGVFIERELVEEIIAELDGEIGIAANPDQANELIAPVMVEKSESKAIVEQAGTDDYKTLKDYLNDVLTDSEATSQ